MKLNKWIPFFIPVLLVLAMPSLGRAASFDQDFAVVFIDQKTEAKYGAIPLSRVVLANGIDAIAKAGAKGLVVKFFLDQSKGVKEDQGLANSISKIPTVLQARIDDSERTPNSLSERFTMAGRFNVAVSGSSGWIPLPIFAQHAADLGFVDFNSTRVPMVEQYQSHTVKSLVLCALELVAGKKAKVSNGKKIEIGSRIFKTDGQNQIDARLIAPGLIHYVSFNDLIDGSANEKLRNKVVILAYDGPNIVKASTSLGVMGAHRYFVNILRSIYDGD
jgi:CHASE2 domain-containing sensor protein